MTVWQGHLLRKLLILIVILVSASYSAESLTVKELIEFYDYDFYDGTVSITNFSDYMVDVNGDSLNDTLIINLSVMAYNSSQYYFIVSLDNGYSLIKNYSNIALNTGENNAHVSFDAKILGKSKYNYSVEILRSDFGLAYKKHDVETANYESYDKGISFVSVSDNNGGNDFIVLNMSFNSTFNSTSNITAFLEYGNKTIYAVREASIVSPETSVLFYFDNESIKSAHYSGSYNIKSIKAGSKVFVVNKSTSHYNYEDFAKSPYIKNITSSVKDFDSDGLSDVLWFNFSLVIKKEAVYNIKANIYTPSGDFFKSLNTRAFLFSGNNSFILEVNGSDVYSTYDNGNFYLPYVSLDADNKVEDAIFNAHSTENINYYDFERPGLPDLIPQIEVSYNALSKESNVTINVANLGETAAFSAVLDVFSDVGFERQRSISYIPSNKSEVFSFIVSNSTPQAVFTAIVDFDNLVDESNESNNAATGATSQLSSLKIDSFSLLNVKENTVLFEIIVFNNGTSDLNDILWSLDFGDGDRIDSVMNFSLASGKSASILVKHIYSQQGNYVADFNVRSYEVSDVMAAEVNATSLFLLTPSEIHSNLSRKIIGFSVVNSQNSSAIFGMAVKFGDGNNISVNDVFLVENQAIFSYVEHEYPDHGSYKFIASINGGSISKPKLIEVEYIGVNNLSLLDLSGNSAVFEGSVRNYLSAPLNGVVWSLSTEELVIDSSNNITMGSLENVFFFLKYDYGSSGFKMANLTMANSSLSSSRVINLTI